MNTKYLMSGTALFLGIIGVALLLIPQELASYFQMEESSVLALQLMGGMYFAFSILNWMYKANTIGGIYGRPVALANFTNFFVGALTFIKIVMAGDHHFSMVIACLIYSVFASAFAYLLFYKRDIK